MKRINLIKKYFALALVMGLVFSNMTVFAAGSNNSGVVALDDPEPEPEPEPKPEPKPDPEPTPGPTKPTTPVEKPATAAKTENKEKSAAEKAAEAVAIEEARVYAEALAIASAESAVLESEAYYGGFKNGAELRLAAAEHKSAGEYNNNAVVTTPGIEKAVPVAQGGNLVIDGQVTGATATISKVSTVYVDSVRASQAGTVLNVVDVAYPAAEATINFYMPGVAAGANVAAVQYVDGAWVNVDVVAVNADHVVLNMKGDGVVAFIAK